MDPKGEPSNPRARWGELPSMSNVEMHDMFATAIAVADELDSLDDATTSLGVQYPGPNPFFSGVESEREIARKARREAAQSSPFYKTIKLLTQDVNTNLDQLTPDQAALEDPTGYHPISKQLRDSVILILAHTGYAEASNEVVEVLTDILEYYMQSFCTLLRQFTDAADLRSPSDFCDTVEKVLHHMNVPNYESLVRYDVEIRAYFEKVKRASELKAASKKQHQQQYQSHSS